MNEILILCLIAGCTLPVKVEIIPSNLPKLAYTIVAKNTCILTFTKESRKDKEIVAHEVCHCAKDYKVIGPYGYENISKLEQNQREIAVKNCGLILSYKELNDPS